MVELMIFITILVAVLNVSEDNNQHFYGVV